MKYLLIGIILAFAFSSKQASAQETMIDEVNYIQLEQFIEMAKANYPRRKIMKLNEQVAKGNVSMQTISILDMFNASYYYRPDQKNAINPENPYVFNGMQYGISLSLGTLVSYPYRIKEAKINHKISIQESLDYDKSLILEMKNRYYTYILQTKELKLRTQAAQDAQAVADNTSLQFERGEIELESFNAAKSNLNSANSAKIQMEMSYLFAKDQLEELIGVKLNEVNKIK